MASPIITPMPVQTDTEYRPISRLAVVGLLLALPSALIFVNENLYWLLPALILPAFLTCLLALRSIRRSEGNLAGEAIALLGIVISVASGLGWITMTTVTKMVTESEAKTAVDEWLSKLFNNEPGAAFLMTNDGKYRNIPFNPEEYGRLRTQFPGEAQGTSAFDNFLIDPICGQILRYGKKFDLKYVGLVESNTTRSSPVFRFGYKFSSPTTTEGSFLIAVRGEDLMTPDGNRRFWKMVVEPNATFSKENAYGQELKRVMAAAQDELERFVNAIANDEMDVVIKKFDPTRLGDLKTVLGYIRPEGRTGPITPRALLKPMRLRADSKSGDTWTLTFDISSNWENDRSVGFSVTLVTSDSKNFTFQDCKFMGVKKLLTETPSSGPGPKRTTLPEQ